MKADPELIHTLRNPRWLIAGALAAIGIVVVALLGGLQAATHPLPRYVAGQRIVTPALAVTLNRAWIDRRGVTGYEDTFTHRHYLVLDAVVTNLTTHSDNSYLKRDLLWLRGEGNGQKAIEADAIYLAQDHTLLGSLQPQLPTHVLMSWEIAPELPMDSPLKWGLRSRQYFAKAYISNQSGWVQDKPAAMFTLPVEDRRSRGATRR